MSRQIWGCYSVADHKVDRAFVADVLLFERLVVPVPPPGDKRFAEWESNRWDPERQQRLMEKLGDVVERVPWTDERRTEWDTRWSRMSAAQEVQGAADWRPVPADAPFLLTRRLISEEVARKANDQRDVRALAVYADPVRFDAEWQFLKAFRFIRRKRRVLARPEDDEPEAERDQPPGERVELAKLLVGKFAVPEDERLTDEQLLERAADLAATARIVTWRRDFHGWLDDISERGISDARIAREMGQLIDSYNRVVRRHSQATAVRHGATVIGTGVGAGAAIWGGPLAYPAKAPVAAVGNVVAERIEDKPREDRVEAGALLAEAAKSLRS